MPTTAPPYITITTAIANCLSVTIYTKDGAQHNVLPNRIIEIAGEWFVEDVFGGMIMGKEVQSAYLQWIKINTDTEF